MRRLRGHVPQLKESACPNKTEDLAGCSETQRGHTPAHVFLGAAFSKKDATRTLAKFD